MIRGLGIDIVDLNRIDRVWKRYGINFARRILHPEELAELSTLSVTDEVSTRFLASRFAAKEAAAKALGTGFSDGVIPQDLQIKKDVSGKPELLLHGRAKECQSRQGSSSAHISFSHEKSASVAVVILED